MLKNSSEYSYSGFGYSYSTLAPSTRSYSMILKVVYSYSKLVYSVVKVEIFLTGRLLCMPEAHNSGGSKIIFLWLLIKRGKWVLDIHLSSHEILNALIIPNTLNFNEL